MDAETIHQWAADVEFERQGPVRRAVKKVLINPFANYMPAGVMRGMLRFGKSELAAANWKDPGGWRSMVISYDAECRQIADKILVGAGSMPMGLRNRRRLAARLIARLIDSSDSEPVEVLCLGAGPGQIISVALLEAQRPAEATLVDLSSDAFAYGRKRAQELGIGEKMRFIQGDVRDVEQMLDRPPDIVKMIGICEYLDDEHISNIAEALAEVCRGETYVVVNSLSPKHGTDRFFRRVFGLNMIYRTPEQIENLLRPAGFSEFVEVPEPLGIYTVVVGRRPPTSEVRNGNDSGNDDRSRGSED